MKSSKQLINKSLYAITFLILIPIMLYLWAKYTADLISLPVIASDTTAYILIGLGVIFMLWAMFSLFKYGKGLPMNAYPPSKFVTKGPYRIFRHPIYWGFGFLMIGFFILIKSASGLWLVAPVTILGMMALVMGYEAIYLKNTFPNQRITTFLDLPENNHSKANARDRVVSFFWVMTALSLGNFLCLQFMDQNMTTTGEPLITSFTGLWPYLPLVSILFIIIIPVVIRNKDVLRYWIISAVIAIGISTFMALFYPEFGAQYLPFTYGAVYFVPAYLILISGKTLLSQSKPAGILYALAGLLFILVQVTLSLSGLLHLGSAVLIFLLAGHYFRVWSFLRKGAENIANSWQEWVIGKVRIINHGFYVGFGTFFGILLAGLLVGDEYAWGILAFAFVVIVFSALWAQIIEGSEKLKRPYGYYGALVGIIFASLITGALGYNVWVLIGVISVLMPWVQGIGRFRCLVNGCCHGSKVDNTNIGIRYFHHRSRVCGISNLRGELLHPTPLYAMLWLFLVGCILLSIYDSFPPSFIFGLYLILTGIGRFVEEAYRGEVQTPYLKGLRLYQWTAILSVLIGIVMTLIPVSTPVIAVNPGWQTVLSALIGGLFTAFAMGVDFPYSNARFSRLV